MTTKELISTLPKKKQEEWNAVFDNDISIAKGDRSDGKYDWVDPDDHLKGINMGNNMKDLTKNANGEYLTKFKTDKHSYRILALEEVSGTHWQVFKQVGTGAGLAKGFKEILDHNDNVVRKVLTAGIGEQNLREVLPKLGQDIVLMNQAFKDDMREFSKERFDSIYLAVSTFIVRDNDDERKWTEDHGNEIIEDMISYGFINRVFFFLLGSRLTGFSKVWNALSKLSPEQSAIFMESGNTMEKSTTEKT